MKKKLLILLLSVCIIRTAKAQIQPVLVKDITVGINSTVFSPYNFIELNGKLFFTTGAATQLWISDGTAIGTKNISGLMPVTSTANEQRHMTKSGNTIFFFWPVWQSTDDYLWKTDGTIAGTQLVKQVYPSVINSRASEIVDMNGTVYFGGHDQLLGDNEFWKSDGSASGTLLVKKINPNNASSPSLFLNLNGSLVFNAVKYNGSTPSGKYFKSDGTANGTLDFFDLTALGPPYQNFNCN